jgi:hypothetical protein
MNKNLGNRQFYSLPVPPLRRCPSGLVEAPAAPLAADEAGGAPDPLAPQGLDAALEFLP